MTLDRILISLNTAGQLIVGSKSITLTGVGAGLGKSGVESAPDISDPYITAIGGQAITAIPSATAFAGTILTPGALEKTIDGTLVSLITAGQLIIDFKAIALETSGAGLGGLIKGAFGARGPSPSVSASPAGGNSLTEPAMLPILA